MRGMAGSSSASANVGTDAQPGANQEDREKERAQYEEYLNEVGADIAAFLDPFGKFILNLFSVCAILCFI